MVNSKAKIPLSKGSLLNIFKGHKVFDPVLQILGVKKISCQKSDKYSILLSDGETRTSRTILATPLNELIKENKLVDNTIVKITLFMLSKTNKFGIEKDIMVILEMQVVMSGTEVKKKIGNPSPIEGDFELIRKRNLPVDNQISAAPQSPGVGMKRRLPVTSPTAESPSKRRLINDLTTRESTACLPISSIIPSQPKWTIKGRVSSKSSLRAYGKDGRMFNFIMIDPSSDIRVVVFTEYVDKYYDVIENSKTYYLSRGRLRNVDRRWYRGKHNYEIHINDDTEITKCNEEMPLPAIQYKVVKIKDLTQVLPTNLVDVIGITYQTEACEKFTSAKSLAYSTRDILLLDDSKHTIVLTLWGKQAEEFNGNNNPIVALKSVGIKNFLSQKTLILGTSTLIEIDPDIPEVHKLRKWFKNECPKAVQFPNLSKPQHNYHCSVPWMSLEEAYEKMLNATNVNEKITFKTKAFVYKFRQDEIIYKSCIGPNCRKKVRRTKQGLYACPKCGKENSIYNNQIFLNLELCDDRISTWVTIDNVGGEKLLGRSADEIATIMEQNLIDEYNDIFEQSISKEYNFTIKFFLDPFNKKEKDIRGFILSVEKIDHAVELKRLIEDTEKKWVMDFSKITL